MEYVGLYGGMVLGFLGWFLGRRAAGKKRGLDEVYHFIWNKARSISWYFTFAAIYVMLMLALSGVQLNIIFALAILLFIHMGSWAITGAIYSFKMTQNDAKQSSILVSLLIGVATIIIFSFVSAATGNWMFTVVSLPPVIMMTAITFVQSRKYNRP
ncbi:hypothetical protein [Paenibacillus sp. IITD108]|uniref:hypothetical protein n=1 Tax=Paenibacillus sp. IITD108 TaxID=3116649 RepID=UPI002F41F942